MDFNLSTNVTFLFQGLIQDTMLYFCFSVL